MNILMVSSEAVPFSKSGGLADVVGALTAELNKIGHDARIIIPAYNMKIEDCGDFVCNIDIPLLAVVKNVSVYVKEYNSSKYYFVCCDFFNERKGIYGDTSFEPYSDNFERFAVLSLTAIELWKVIDFKVDIFHCHDWTAGLLPYFLQESNSKFFMNTKTVFTIHNLAYQGTFSRMDFLLTKKTPNIGLFKNDQINMMQCGLLFSDFITTVSPTYSREIQMQDQGCGLDGILVERSKFLTGILNGIDTQEWNPENDKYLDRGFSVFDLSGKKALKAQMQKEFRLEVNENIPVFAMISRLASQKGFDALLPVLENILKNNKVQFLIIGTGDSRLEIALSEMAERNPNLSVNILFSNKAAHLVEAGADFFLMPSRYEPCGLNQMYSLRYGTLPLVRRTGGLADTVIDVDENPEEGNGFVFEMLSPESIESTVLRAVKLYESGKMNEIVKRAMSADFSWKKSAEKYVELYKSLFARS